MGEKPKKLNHEKMQRPKDSFSKGRRVLTESGLEDDEIRPWTPSKVSMDLQTLLTD